MTIRKDSVWGEPGPLPPHGVTVRSDREAREVVTTARRAGEPIPPLGLLGGDLCRTLGGRGDEGRLRSHEAMSFPVDLGSVLVDGRLHWFVAHLVARRSWWFGRVLVAMNAQFLGAWDVAPKSHPNDGRLDVLDSDLPLGQRFQARVRLRSGTHVPHPGIDERRVTSVQIDLARPTAVELDGDPVGTARQLSIRVEPDALRCVI